MATHSGTATTDHQEIRQWVEERGGRPATVAGTGGDGAGVLRIDFQDQDEDLEPLSWDDFFAKFDEENLAFLHGDGDSRFNKFVNR